MDISDRLQRDLQEAMKARDTVRRSTLRLVRAAMVNAEKESGGKLDQQDIINILDREAKRRREAIQQFSDAGRLELAAREEAELKILQEYLPQQMSDRELEALTREVISSLGAEGPSDLGRVMKELMPQVKGRAEGGKVNQLVRRLLSE